MSDPDAAWVDTIDALLPQTQCTRCGYPDCRRYAQAVAAGAADINRCPPGGDDTVAKLSALTGRPRVALDPDCGAFYPRRLAIVDEASFELPPDIDSFADAEGRPRIFADCATIQVSK